MAIRQFIFQNSFKPKKVFLRLFFMGLSLFASAQNINETKKITPLKMNQKIIIDGVLNEPVWKKNCITKELFNENGVWNNTVAYFIYDSGNLYAAMICNTNDASLLNKKHVDKDDEQMLANDWVAFCVDTYHDGINAFAFIVDAAGNTLDGALNPTSRDLSFSFSSDWTAAVKKDKDSYIVELKIPLKKLPIMWNKDGVTMGIQIIRNDKQNSRMTQWPNTKNIGNFEPV